MDYDNYILRRYPITEKERELFQDITEEIPLSN